MACLSSSSAGYSNKSGSLALLAVCQGQLPTPAVRRLSMRLANLLWRDASGCSALSLSGGISSVCVLEGVRQLTKELKLSTLLVDEYIPVQYQVSKKNIYQGIKQLLNIFFFRKLSKNTYPGAKNMESGKSRE